MIDLNLIDSDEEIESIMKNYRIFKQVSDEYSNLVYCFGIIDYFQKWTFGKYMERFAKRFTNCNSNLNTSAQPPRKYALRFQEFVKSILIE